MADDIAATLAGIRERAKQGMTAPFDSAEAIRGSIESAADVPRLLAAVEAALAWHEEFDGTCSTCTDAYGDPAAWPCPEYRAVTAALAGKAAPVPRT